MTRHLMLDQPLERDEFDPVCWTWCGQLVELEETREDPTVVDCDVCLDLYEDDPPR